MFRRFLFLLLLMIALIVGGLWAYRTFIQKEPYVFPWLPPEEPEAIIPEAPVMKSPETKPPQPEEPGWPPLPAPHVQKLIESLMQQTQITRSYDPSYVRLNYPGGDVPESTGVCADVIVRSFRANGVDLQKELHEDMRRNFSKYPQKWNLKRPDSNIDHRRVYNLMRFFERKGASLPVSDNPADYQPGDVVAWDLGNGQAHIGIVTHMQTTDGIPLIGHNVAYGTNIENALFFWPIIGHYRYFSEQEDVNVARPDRTTTALPQ